MSWPRTPSIYTEFSALLRRLPLHRLSRRELYDMARGSDLGLAIATGEQRTYATLLLTIGVVLPR